VPLAFSLIQVCCGATDQALALRISGAWDRSHPPPSPACRHKPPVPPQVAYQRPFEAVLWAMPASGFTDFASEFWDSPGWLTT
jgi:hypothetical protein